MNSNYKPAHAARPRGVEVIMANHRSDCRSAASPAEPAIDSPADEVRCNQCELFALLSFIVLSFAGFFFCFYVVLAKCRGTWPY